MQLKLGLREVGAVMLILTLGLAYLLVSFINTLAEMSQASCTCGDTCDMVHFEVPTYFYFGLAGIVILLLISVLFVVKGGEVFKAKTAPQDAWKEMQDTLKGDEKTVYSLIAAEGGAMFQSEIVEKSELSKVKITRVLDGLEARKVLERKRRGMTNIVVLK
ncbi:MAG: hypothetical protein ABH950_09405 [Candidatus Altiarchaeota archaeon]